MPVSEGTVAGKNRKPVPDGTVSKKDKKPLSIENKETADKIPAYYDVEERTDGTLFLEETAEKTGEDSSGEEYSNQQDSLTLEDMVGTYRQVQYQYRLLETFIM
jgi:hypothetical protein